MRFERILVAWVPAAVLLLLVVLEWTGRTDWVPWLGPAREPAPRSMPFFDESSERRPDAFALRPGGFQGLKPGLARVVEGVPASAQALEALAVGGSQRFRFNLLAGVSYEMRVTRLLPVSEGGKLWRGVTDDGRALLTLVGGPAGAPLGSERETFYLGALRDREGGSFRFQGVAGEVGFLVNTLEALVAQDCELASDVAFRGERSAVAFKRSKIDVLVAYTEQAMAEAVAGASEVYMQRYCDLEVALTNAAFHASEVEHTLNLRGTFLLKGDDEKGGLEGILRALDSNEARMKAVRDQRKTLKADLVVLLVSKAAAAGKEYAGMARIMTVPSVAFAPHAFAVVTVRAVTPYEFDTFTFPHEVAHLFGCCHAKDDKPPCTGATGYAHGWRFKSKSGEELATLMCYDPGRRVNQLSSFAVLWDRDGERTGVKDAAENARVVNENGAIVEQFDQHLP